MKIKDHLIVSRESHCISESEVKNFLNISEDNKISSFIPTLISSAETILENYIAKCLINRKIIYSYFGNSISFPYYPINKILKIAINNVEEKISEDPINFKKRIFSEEKYFYIEYEAGFEKTPPSLMHAVLIIVDNFLKNDLIKIDKDIMKCVDVIVREFK